MSEDWGAIAAEVAEGIGQVGFTAYLRKPGGPLGPAHNPTGMGPAMYYPVTVVQGASRVRDRDGTLVGETRRTLTISTAGLPETFEGGTIEPAKGDRILVGEGSAEVFADDGLFLKQSHEIADLRDVAPGGVPLMWKVELVA